MITASLLSLKSKHFYSFLLIHHNKALYRKGNMDSELQIIKLS